LIGSRLARIRIAAETVLIALTILRLNGRHRSMNRNAKRIE
jgi:hypothetical protein